MLQLLRQLASLVRAWWRRDRIRCSPGEGRLLRLTPGSALVVDQRTAVVLRRRVGQTNSGAYVAYECDSALGSCELRVELSGSTRDARLWWVEGATERAISAEDVSAYPAARPKLTGYNVRPDG